MARVEVFGYSDDLIEIDGDIQEEWGAYGDDHNLLSFSDGTILSIAFDPDGSGCWRITTRCNGSAALTIARALGEEADGDDYYTDKAVIDGNIRWVVRGTDIATVKVKH